MKQCLFRYTKRNP